MNFQFQYPQAFFLLALIPVFVLIFLYYQSRKKKAISKMGEVKLVKALMPDHAPKKTVIKFCMAMLAFALGCIALANPRVPDASSSEARNGIDIVFALDISNSMKAGDIAPDRLSRAKQFITKMIDNLPDDRIGLVVFAGNAYAQMPLSFDKEAARMYTLTADPKNIAAQGTSVGDAFEKSGFLFGDESERFRSVVLITDGETHDENAIEKAKEMAEKGIMINTIGIGSIEGSTIMDSSGNQKRDATGQIVISKLNENFLKELARMTNGVYVHLQSTEAAVNEVSAQFSQIEKKALGDTSLFNYNSYYAWLGFPMLLLIIGEIFLPDRKRIKQ